MKDEDKTKEQLMNELVELRQRIAELEASETGHIRRETALKQAEQEKQTILDSLVEHVIYHDLDMRMLWANRAACQSVGRTREELVGRHCYEIWAERSDPCEDCPVKGSRETGQPQAVEKMTPDGRFWFIQGSVVRDSNGDIVGMVELTLDITERKRAEEAVRKAHDELGQRVEERTAELLKTNEQLKHQIEERKQVEEALRSAHGRLRATFDAIQENMNIVDLDFYLTDVNEVLINSFGLSDRESVLGRKCFEVLKGQKDICSNCAVAEVYRTKAPAYRTSTSEDEVLTAGKSFEIFAYPIVDEYGNLSGAVEFARDITERKRAEEALRESEERFRTAFDNAATGISLVANDGYFLKVNSTLCKMLGYSEQELLTKSWVDITSPDDLIGCYEWLRRVKEGEDSAYEKRFLHKLGHPVWVLVSSSLLRNSKGRTLYYISLFQDITVRKRAEKALQESEERFRAIFETAQDSIFIKDRSLKYSQVNPAMERLFELPASKLIGLTDEDLFGEEAGSYIREIDSRVLGGEIIEEEHTKPVKGIPRTFDVIKVPIHGNSGEIVGLCGIARDITERKEAEEALLRAHEELESRVEERTVELVKLNEKLKQEIEERKQVEQELRKREVELETKTNELEEVNTALRVLLKRRDEDKTELGEKILCNVKELVLPYVERLKSSELDTRQTTYVSILESNLNDIVSPFANKLSSKYLGLTPTEIQIANLVKQGRTSKEIAEILNSSDRTVEFHRNNIRKKIGIKNRKANLRSHLLSM